MKVAIHQPDFFPWLGVFDKVTKCDSFIILDNVQFPKGGGGNWSNHVKLIVQGRADWITVPVVRSYHGLRLIREMEIQPNSVWRKKLLKTIQTNYARAPFFKQLTPLISDLINYPTYNLSDFNINAFKAFLSLLELDTPLILGSTLPASGKATDLLVSIVKSVGGDVYLCGGGAAGYQEDDKFPQHGIELIYQNFKHPIYPQCNTDAFVPGLSIIDPLMNCGVDGVKELLLSNGHRVD